MNVTQFFQPYLLGYAGRVIDSLKNEYEINGLHGHQSFMKFHVKGLTKKTIVIYLERFAQMSVALNKWSIKEFVEQWTTAGILEICFIQG